MKPPMKQDSEEKAQSKNFSDTQKIRTSPQGRLELIHMGGATVSKGVFEPG